MNYIRLYGDYENAIANQKCVIKKYRERLSEARGSLNHREICRLNGILYMLYEEKSELEERAAELQKYVS